MKLLDQVRNYIRKKLYSIGAGEETGAASGAMSKEEARRMLPLLLLDNGGR